VSRTDRIYDQAEELCWLLFGVHYHTLEVTDWPRVASYYVARRLLEGEDNIFRSLREVTDAVHRYNRNLITSMEKSDGHQDPSGGQAPEERLVGRAIARYPGGSFYEQVTGRPQG
jgi:hypothetical protein